METWRLLVAEDEPSAWLSIQRILQNARLRIHPGEDEIAFHLQWAETAEKALEIIETAPPDLLLLDYMLPGMNGIELLQKLEPKRLDMLTIIITGYATIETAVMATKSGAFDFLPKPFTPKELTETVRKAAGHLAVSRQARRLEEEKRRMRFQFIQVLAHELKAPLAAVEGYLAMLHERAAGNDISAYDRLIDRCQVRVEGMRKMIHDLLDLTRIESGTKKRELANIDAVESARAAIETVRPLARLRNIAINFSPPSAPLTFRADRGELDIILNNLISNAVKYNRDDGSVNVGLRLVEDALEITVSDTGIGLTPEECSKLFGDFVRIKNEKTRNILGSGLGLSIVKKLAQLYNGDIQVESQSGSGSQFTITLRSA